MATNETPSKYSKLIPRLEDAYDGAVAHGAAIGLLQNVAATLRAVLDALVGTPAGPGNVPPAVEGTRSKWDNAKPAKTVKNAAAEAAKRDGRKMVRTCQNVLKPVLGDSWNTNWQTAGFIGGSLAVAPNPATQLQGLRQYFVDNPGFEVNNPLSQLVATADACEAQAQLISTTESESNQADANADAAKTAYDNSMAEARMRLTGLRGELQQLLADDSEIWYAFGFNKPSDPETPEVATGLVATAGAAGSRSMSYVWNQARRADSSRVIVFLTATPTTILANTIVQDRNYTFTGEAGGLADVSATVTSRNSNGGESAASTALAMTLP
jgi:hypothetical protein